ncbi:MAG: hypothetical protein JWO38_7327 [Gemmataceae bacterium]|nr:hypothetical protein [Gemmataceae bacterium]
MIRWALGVAVVVCLTAPLPAQNKPEDLVVRAITAHGGVDALKKFPAGTSKIAGKVIMAGVEFPFTGALAFEIPGKARMEMALEQGDMKTTLLQVVNGVKVRQTENGMVSRLDEAVQAELRESAVIQEMSLLYPLLDPKKFTLKTEPDATVVGRECVVLAARARGLKDTILFFDKKTGQLAAMRRKGLSPAQKTVDEFTIFSDYKTIQGLVVPMKTKVMHDGKPFLEITVSEYTPLEKIDEKLFTTE